ncbi:MAG: type II secretion system protein F, partial [Actinomycetota bacterium]|nr:type II secretion system protein F [Actinomycetota bacterium]
MTVGAALGLCVGVGLLLVWLSLTGAPRVRRPAPSGGGITDLLRRAGLVGVSPLAVVSVSAGCAAVAGALMLAVSGTAPVSGLFAAWGAYVPVALLRGRARRRQRELADVWPETVDNLASAVRAGMSLPEA